MQVVLHGGAGGDPTRPRRRQAVLDEAAATALEADDPEGAVVAGVAHLERSGRFNAGHGATIQSDGIHRLDAGIMTGDRVVGAVCGVTRVDSTVELARAVKDETPHVLLGPAGAHDLAGTVGLRTEEPVGSSERAEAFADLDVPEGFAGQLGAVADRFGADHDTVGAVARDGDRLAAATSTGGRWLALKGRVGDVPQVGSGFYCSPHGAVSTTGHGEAIARVTLARSVERRLADGADAQAAATAAVARLEATTGGDAGVIAVDSAGHIGTAFNTARMQTAASDDG